MEDSISRLKKLPEQYSELITTLNDAAITIVDTSYMLFRLFRRKHLLQLSN